jgi:putative transferase (TIGR04331 family)
MPRYLISTAFECTWPDQQPVLMLGEWCRRFSRRDAWRGYDVAVVPYHWDDREKLLEDYKHLSALYEELLKEIAVCLNEIHRVDYSLKYWRIVVGPWLGHFVQVLFDRWSVLARAIRDFEVGGITVLNTDSKLMVAADMNEYIAMHVDDAWNEEIIKQLILNYTSIPVIHVDPQPDFAGSKNLNARAGIRGYLKVVWDGLSGYVLSMVTRQDEAFFIATSLPKRIEWWLQIALGQLPKPARRVSPPKKAVSSSMREWSIGNRESLHRNDFERIVRDLIPKHLPTVYLEGYVALRHICNLLPWPSSPSVIFTSNAFSSDDVFKAWAAEKVELGAPLVIGQHGGNYGMALWSYMEEHQIAITDKYLSWGWSRQGEPKVEAVCNLKVVGQSQLWDPDGGALMIELTLPRFSYQMFSSPVAGQWLNYFDDQCRFVRTLPERIRRQLTVRLYSDYGWDEAERWRYQFPDIRLDSGIKPLSGLIARSRISISTYNATVFLESLALNVPTIVFWDPLYWELNDEASRDMQVLKDAGIFHDIPESAAELLAQVWDDVPGWWAGDVVQQAREKFCAKYSRTPKNPLKHLESALRGAMRTKAKHTNHESQIKTR